MSSLQQSLDQQRAASAWNYVTEEVKGRTFAADYGSLAKRVPSLILGNGLGQTLAFLKAKGKNNPNDEHEVIYTHLSLWVMSQVEPSSEKSLLEWILKRDSHSYRRATAEALAFLLWLKRFAEAELPASREGTE